MDRLGRVVGTGRAAAAVPRLKQVPGRPRVPDRQALCGILFVLHTGIQWEYLPTAGRLRARTGAESRLAWIIR